MYLRFMFALSHTCDHYSAVEKCHLLVPDVSFIWSKDSCCTTLNFLYCAKRWINFLCNKHIPLAQRNSVWPDVNEIFENAMPPKNLKSSFEEPSHTGRGFRQRILFVRPTTKLAQYLFFKFVFLWVKMSRPFSRTTISFQMLFFIFNRQSLKNSLSPKLIFACVGDLLYFDAKFRSVDYFKQIMVFQIKSVPRWKPLVAKNH